jgi:hypothetical protein
MRTTSRPPRPPDPRATLPLKRSSPQSGEAAESSSRARVVKGMEPKEAPLGAYLMARAALHRKVEGQDLEHLRAGSASVREVHDLMPLGRSNVREDIGKAKDAHLPLRKLASQELIDALMLENKFDHEVTDTEITRAGAAANVYARTGTCGAYAALANPLHAAKLAGMQDERAIVSQAEHRTIDHAWSELIPRGKREDGTPILHGKDVIMDGWCREKLAILREDSEYARLAADGSANQLKHQDLLDHKTGPEAWKSVKGYQAQIEGSARLRYLFQRTLDRHVDAGTEMPDEYLWDAETVFHNDFREQACKALHAKQPSPAEGAGVPGAGSAADRPAHPALAEIQAVGVARSLDANIRGAVAAAPGILAAARDMFPIRDRVHKDESLRPEETP